MPQNIYFPIEYLQDIAINNDLGLFIEYILKKIKFYFEIIPCERKWELKTIVQNFNLNSFLFPFPMVRYFLQDCSPPSVVPSQRHFCWCCISPNLIFLLERCCIKIKIIFWAAECNSQHGILKSNNEVEDVTKNPFLGKNLKTWWYVRVYICLTKKSLKC